MPARFDRRRDDRGTVGATTPETDDAMTRSEEELRVGTERRETGRARLKKFVVTEQVETTVPVQREEVRIEREPITDANRDAALSGGDITEEEHEVTLHAEEPVVEKDVVPKERVRMDTDVVTDERQISEDVRKERIETGDDDPLARGGDEEQRRPRPLVAALRLAQAEARAQRGRRPRRPPRAAGRWR